jgi:nuclear receptor coactivator 2
MSNGVFQISSTFLGLTSEKAEGDDITSESAESSRCMICVARRITPNEDTSGVASELFITKLDTTGKIIGIDTSGVSSTYSQYLNRVKFVDLTVVLF